MKKSLLIAVSAGSLVLGGGWWLGRAEPQDGQVLDVQHAECTIFGPQREKFLGGWKEARERWRLSRMTDDVAARLPDPRAVAEAAAATAGGSIPSIPGGSRTAAKRRPSDGQYSNLIDQYIFPALSDAGVQPAVKTNDFEFVRRVTLDLAGRIPTADRVLAFQGDPRDNKREALIDELLASPQWIDKWTMFFGDLYKNAANLPSAGINRYPEGRNAFNQWIRDSLANNRPYDGMARQLIAARGANSYQQGELNWLVSGLVTNVRNIPQDTWDQQTANVAETFLGIAHVNCILCHNGRGHLDTLSLWGKNASRYDMWQLSAFMSRTTITQTRPDPNSRQYYWTVNESGAPLNARNPDYSLNTTAGNRPARQPVGTVTSVEPMYPFSGGIQTPGETFRQALAREITNDFQFSRAAVNYIWKHFFARGLVDPVNQFDPARLDPDNPPPDPWTLQPSNARLLNALAQDFIDSGYDIKHLMKLITTSEAYQLSARYNGAWDPKWEPLFARRLVRRLWGEEIADSLAISSNIANTYTVDGTVRLNWAMQIPEPSALRGNAFLQAFLPGNRDDQERRSEGSVQQALALMNDAFVNQKLQVAGTGDNASLLARALAGRDDNLVFLLYINILSRYPTDDEKNAASALLASGDRRQKAQQLMWSLCNKVDFIFNY